MILAVVCAAMAGCQKQNQPGGNTGENGGNEGGNEGGNGGTQPSAKVEIVVDVVDIDANCATIQMDVTSGNATKGRIVEYVNTTDLSFDPASVEPVDLILYIMDNGVDFDITGNSYTKNLTNLRIGGDRFTAVAVYNESGQLAAAASKVWTPVGLAEGWSTSNNPGNLDENVW